MNFNTGRREFLRAAVVLSGAAVLAACTPKATPIAEEPAVAKTPEVAPTPTQAASPASTERVNLVMATWTAAANLPAWEEAIAVFEEKYPIDLTMEHTPGQAYWDNLNVSYAGGTPPDIIYTPPTNAQDTGTRGMLTDLTPFIEQDGVSLDDINPVSQKPYVWDGAVWAVAVVNDTRYTIYNKTMFREAGLPDLPEVWDGDFSVEQFVEYGQKLTNPDTQTWGYVFEGNSSAARMIWLFGAHYWDNEEMPTRAVMDSPEGIEGFQFLQDMVYKYKIAPSTAETSAGSDPMFQTGKVGMIWAGYKSAAAVHKDIKDFEWGITTIPKATVRVSNVSPQAFAVVSKSKAPKEAWSFVKYAAWEDGQRILTQSTSMPANVNFDFNSVSPLQPWQNTLLQDALKTGRAEVPHPNVRPQMLTIINEEMDELMANTKTAEQVATDMAARINEIFESHA